MYQRILVGTDGTESSRLAVRHALDLGRLSGGKVDVVAVVRPGDGLVGLAEGAGAGVVAAGAALTAALREHYTEVLREVRTEAEQLGVEVEAKVVEGSNVASTIVGLAEAAGVDVIVVGNRGMKGARRLLGSVPNAVAHAAGCAVLIVPTT